MKTRTACVWIFLAHLISAASASAMCTLPGDPPSALTTDNCVSAGDAATPWRYLATNSGAMACPTATGWSSGKLFGDGQLPPALDNYCRYEAIDESSSVIAVATLVPSATWLAACGTRSAIGKAVV